MATIKSYTDLEQSKKLAEILPLESADMLFQLGEDKYADSIRVPLTKKHWEQMMPDIIPCWSLAALLDILAKKQDFIIKSLSYDNKYQYNIDVPSRHCKIWFSSLLDAAFEMIWWLKENNKL